MAVEGKTDYVPGKTVAEVSAKVEVGRRRLARTLPRTVGLTETGWSTLDTARPDLGETIDDIARVVQALSGHKQAGSGEAAALLRVVANAMRSLVAQAQAKALACTSARHGRAAPG